MTRQQFWAERYALYVQTKPVSVAEQLANYDLEAFDRTFSERFYEPEDKKLPIKQPKYDPADFKHPDMVTTTITEPPPLEKQYEHPDFVPDWKDAPEDAVAVAMEKDGRWFWWKENPTPKLFYAGKWNTYHGKGLCSEHFAGKTTNTSKLHPDFWKHSLQERPKNDNQPLS